MSFRSFLDRFVHPWIAAVAIVGVVLWVLAFVVAGTGVVLRSLGVEYLLAFRLFFASSLVGIAGMAVLAACGCYLVCVRTIQVVAAW